MVQLVAAVGKGNVGVKKWQSLMPVLPRNWEASLKRPMGRSPQVAPKWVKIQLPLRSEERAPHPLGMTPLGWAPIVEELHQLELPIWKKMSSLMVPLMTSISGLLEALPS